MDKEGWYIYSVEYYLAIKRNEIESFKDMGAGGEGGGRGDRDGEDK